ncbi:MAG: glycosyltransferase family 2 protein [Streptococcaceae bacterium]|nr:glycosyltransferase family 2 protein [Streptococcaceae bacterium]
MEELAIIVPVYNEEETIELFIEAVNKKTTPLQLKKTFYFVNDGSKDNTLSIIKKLALQEKNINYISFSRNFGKEAALLAGLQATHESFVTIMDVDLQDPPELLTQMYDKILEGYDVVGTRRISRQGEPFIISSLSRLFYKTFNKISSTPIVDGVRDFRLMTRQVVDSILTLEENNRFSKGLFAWVGYNVVYLEYPNHERSAGKTSWTFRELLSYSIDGLMNFSEAPLNIATFVGVLSFFISLILGIFYIIKTLIFGDPVQGFPTLIVLILLLGGLQLLSLGIIGKYIAKIFLETKKRPNYIIKETNLY